MLQIRNSQDRGQTKTDWLDSRHSFSFGWYHDPRNMGFGPLRVINDDWIAPNGGFDPHPHRDMEIISYLVEGELEHKDSLGSGSVIGTGEIQVMSAGSGITHSEFNPSDRVTTRLLQIWIQPDRRNLKPNYQQKPLQKSEKGQLRLLVSGEESVDPEVMQIRQNAKVYATQMEKEHCLRIPLDNARRYWLQVVRGSLQVNGLSLNEGDGLAISAEQELELDHAVDAELLFFDLP